MEIIWHEIRVSENEHHKLNIIGQEHNSKKSGGVVVSLPVINILQNKSLTNYWLSCIMSVQTKPVEAYDLGFVEQFTK